MRHTRACLGILVGLSLMVTHASAGAGQDACSALKKEDVAAVLGGTFSEPKAKGPLPAGPGSTVTSCEYTGSGSIRVALNVTQLPASQVAAFKSYCTDHEGLAGLGDLACWYNKAHEELHVFKGAAFLSIELRGKSNPTDAIKALARKAVDQLK